MAEKRRRRQSFLVDKRFQFKFCFFVSSWVFAMSLIYPLVIYNIFEFFINFFQQELSSDTAGSVGSIRRDVLILLVLMEVVFIGVIFLISFFMSHKIAGPVYKLKKYLRYVAETGDLGEKLKFRKNDHFKELAEDYNSAFNRLRRDRNDLAQAIQEVIDEQAQKQDSDQQLVEKLKELRDRAEV